MLSVVLEHLERLRAELELIDPARDTAAGDKVADIAAALHGMLADPAAAEAAGQSSSRRAA